MRGLLLFLLGMPLAAFAQTSSPSPRLTGIVHVGDLKLAIIQPSSPPRREVVLRERQREGHVEIFTIDSTNRTVTARLAANDELHVVALTNSGSVINHEVPGLALEAAGLQTVLYLFAEFSDRTILQHPLLPNKQFSLASGATNRAEAAQILKRALSEKRIAVVPDGAKFLLVAPEEMISALNPRSGEIATTNPSSTKGELFPRGSINFDAATLANVLMIYAEFLGGKLDDTGRPLRDGKVVLKVQTALTKEERLYAFETLVGWQGIKLVPTGTGLFKAVSTD